MRNALQQIVYTMIRQFKLAALVFGLALFGCQQTKKCQPPAEQQFATFTETPWRLVSTTDPNPSFRQLSLFNFFIITFRRNFTGDFKRVENNEQYETPVASFTYQLDSSNKRIRAEITQNTVSAQPNPAPDGTPALPQTRPASIVDYLYTLNREFTLQGTNTGFIYRFVPFVGVVNPDQECSF